MHNAHDGQHLALYGYLIDRFDNGLVLRVGTAGLQPYVVPFPVIAFERHFVVIDQPCAHHIAVARLGSDFHQDNVIVQNVGAHHGIPLYAQGENVPGVGNQFGRDPYALGRLRPSADFADVDGIAGDDIAQQGYLEQPLFFLAMRREAQFDRARPVDADRAADFLPAEDELVLFQLVQIVVDDGSAGNARVITDFPDRLHQSQ